MGTAMKQSLRVAVVGHLGQSHFFGAERSLLDILAATSPRCSVTCVLPAGSDPEYIRAVERLTPKIKLLPYRWWRCGQPLDAAAVQKFEQLLREDQISLVHVNTITIMDAFVAARNVGVPSILHAREIIDQNPPLIEALGGEPSEIIARIRDAADFVIANSDATHRLYRKESKSFRLYNCVDTERFDLPNEPEPERLRVGIVSSNGPGKGLAAFVELASMAAACDPKLEFLVFGPQTPFLTALMGRVRQENPSARIEFRGYVNDPIDAIREVNVLTSLSLAPESFGRTVAEAMAARRPVVAYRTGAMPELVREEVDGFLVDDGDVGALLQRLRQLASDHRRLSEMGRAARTRTQKLFSPASFARDLNNIYRRVLRKWNFDRRWRKLLPRARVRPTESHSHSL